MVGSIDSYLAKQSNIVLNTTVEQEACPNNLAPTTSTTAQLVMGDAIATCLIELKGFGSDEFQNCIPAECSEKNYISAFQTSMPIMKSLLDRGTSPERSDRGDHKRYWGYRSQR